ncbi:integrase core domain-containing protein [Defluviimonas sp. SAOS-178_SWC]|uniref:integrase core domain-containing protein n=1 Tax=Defluviimonas sp. SAOS-178_SWC TaxID=3121287 RepID=UPI003D80A6B5
MAGHESYNAIVRLECLAQHWFLSREDAREKVETWRREYNEARPHGAIGDQPPMAMLPWLKTSSLADQPPGFHT